MKRIFTNKWFLIAIAVLAIAALILVKIYWPTAFPSLLKAILVGVVLWILAEVGMRAWQKRKRKAFDEGLTAKEGIEDRKREWEGFQAELDKQKIDRYELPFYLLVGEPQSGKSVLLQNSDLHFPFGQNKLSGIGGTRGCDWWFTEEAVILDLAGRLFTHEGGVADQVEWEAFLDLLTSFRPICPANGILLVVPCDSLLSDSVDVSRQKANKIQAALLTLAKKLEAQLPIYLILTKGDKLFGFAESVHRLDAAKRHEMFGWSRGADKVDALFDLEEARAGFREIVARARLLRGEMLSSVRIPEALSEVDRMFAFPDELAALEEPLELYLRRVFTDSGLSDRLAFRGIYLTSGLQAGVPIARVCAQALGGVGDADMQELEGLFAKQRAYFIKDLIRARVFGERGLVRPTQGRVLAAQRRALIGYGVSAVFALAAVINGIVYMVRDGNTNLARLTDEALTLASNAGSENSKTWKLPDHLKVLAAIHDAEALERPTEESEFNSTRKQLRHLYVTDFDRLLVPALRQAIQVHVGVHVAKFEGLLEPAQLLDIQVHAGKDGGGTGTFEDAKRAVDCMVLILGEEKDFSSNDSFKLAEAILDPEEKTCAPTGRSTAFTLEQAVELRREYKEDEALPAFNPGSKLPDLLDLAKRTLGVFEQSLTPGSPYQPNDALGYLLGWSGLEKSYRQLTAKDVITNDTVFDLMQTFVDSRARMESCTKNMDHQGGLQSYQIKYLNDFVYPLFKEIHVSRKALADLVASRSGNNHPIAPWKQFSELWTFASAAYSTPATDIENLIYLNPVELFAKLTTVFGVYVNKELLVPTAELAPLLNNKELDLACRALPNALWTVDTLGKEIEDSVRDLATTTVGVNAYLAKILEVGRRFGKLYPSWDALADKRALDKRPLAKDHLESELITSLDKARKALEKFDLERTRDFRQAIETILRQHLDALNKQWDVLNKQRDVVTASQAGGECPKIDKAILQTLEDVRGGNSARPNDKVGKAANDLKEKYLQRCQQLMLEYWQSQTPLDESTIEQSLGGAVTLKIVGEIAEHIKLMKELLGTPGTGGESGLDVDWTASVDEMLKVRIDLHKKVLGDYWKPEPLPEHDDSSLYAVAQWVSQQLDQETVGKFITNAVKSVNALDLDDPSLLSGSTVFKTLKHAEESMGFLRGLRVPKDANFMLRQNFFKEVLAPQAASIVANPKLCENGPQLVLKLLFLDRYKLADGLPKNASGLYGKLLFEPLRERIRQEVQRLYLADLKTLILGKYKNAIDALYTPNLDAAKDIAEDTVMNELNLLLKRGGDLDKLKRDYDPSLLPQDQSLGDPELWAMEQFLTKLQAFLLPKDGTNILDCTVKVKFEPIWAVNSLWNQILSNNNIQWFYAPRTSVATETNGQPTGEKMPATFLDWDFAPDKDKRLKMRWSPQSSGALQNGDLQVVVFGSLAPLLMVWIGQENNKDASGAWTFKVQPKGSQLPCSFKISFGDRDLPALPKNRPK